MVDDSQPERTSGDASRPLSKLRERLEDDACRSRSASLGERMRMEAESAMEWETIFRGGARYSEDWLAEAPLIAEGNEHRIFQSEDGSRAIKITRPKRFFRACSSPLMFISGLLPSSVNERGTSRSAGSTVIDWEDVTNWQ